MVRFQPVLAGLHIFGEHKWKKSGCQVLIILWYMRQRREGDRGADKSLEFICPRDHPDGWLVLHSPKLMVILCQDYLIIESFFQTLSRIPVPSLQSRSFFFSQIPLLPSPSSLTYISPPPSSSYNCKPNKLSIFIILLIKWHSLTTVH